MCVSMQIANFSYFFSLIEYSSSTYIKDISIIDCKKSTENCHKQNVKWDRKESEERKL